MRGKLRSGEARGRAAGGDDGGGGGIKLERPPAPVGVLIGEGGESAGLRDGSALGFAVKNEQRNRLVAAAHMQRRVSDNLQDTGHRLGGVDLNGSGGKFLQLRRPLLLPEGLLTHHAVLAIQ